MAKKAYDIGYTSGKHEVLSLSEEIRYKGRRIKIEVTKNPKSSKSDLKKSDSRKSGSRKSESRRTDKDSIKDKYVINGKAAINKRSKDSKKRRK